VSIGLFHGVAVILFTACAFFLGATTYYFTVMAREVDRQLPPSRIAWFFAWAAANSLHRRYYPESPLRKKWFCSVIGVWICGLLGFFFWTK